MPSFAQFGNDLYTGRRSIDFVGRRKLWYLIAAVAVAISLAGVGIRGLNLGIEFKGGSEFRVTASQVTSQAAGEQAVHTVAPAAEVRVSKVGSSGMRVTTDRLADSQVDPVRNAIATAYRVPVEEVSSSFVGPTWGQDVSNKALTGLVVFLIAVALVIALYFRTWTMAVAAIVALIHDLILTVGVYAIVGFEVSPASVIGFLTILGYSLYDTVVVFDKVRENTDSITASTKRTYSEAANLAINQTLVRSINTSIVALLPVASILFIGAFLLGAGTLKDISLSLFVGIAAGTYSSVFIATPLLAELRQREPEMRAQADRVRRRRTEAAAAVTAGGGVLVGVGAGGSADPADPGDFDPDGDGLEVTDAHPGGGTGQRQQPRRNATRNRPSGRKR
jgi:preprotein translocase subunit SecF